MRDTSLYATLPANLEFADVPFGDEPTVDNAIAAAFIRRYAGPTKDAYYAALLNWGDYCDRSNIAPLTASSCDVEGWLCLLEQRGQAKTTTLRYISILSGYYKEAIKVGACDQNPTAGVRRPPNASQLGNRETVAMGSGQVRRFLAIAKQQGILHNLVACLLLFDRLRVSQVVSINMEDLGGRPGSRTVHIRRRGGVSACVRLAPESALALDEYLRLTRIRSSHGRNRGQGALLLAPDDMRYVDYDDALYRRLSRFQTYRLVRHIAERAGLVAYVTPQSLQQGRLAPVFDPPSPARPTSDSKNQLLPII